jgi:hypothetical protein
MEQLLSPILLVIAGSYFLFRNVSYLRNEEKFKQYLEKSPKGQIWVNKIGMEKTLKRSKSIFLPLGITIALVLLGAGIYSIIQAI